jgi:hypothetical protein
LSLRKRVPKYLFATCPSLTRYASDFHPSQGALNDDFAQL